MTKGNMTTIAASRLQQPSLISNKKQATVTMIGLRQDSIASSSRHRSKLSKKQQSLVKVGSSVTFNYNGKKVRGLVRYLGQTDFSANNLCGIELSEDIGKHNGTVKGKTYFRSPENCAVFVPLKKVTIANPITLYGNFKPRKLELPTNTTSSSAAAAATSPTRADEETTTDEEEEEEEDMRITIRSCKASETPSPSTLDNKLSTTGWKPNDSPVPVSSERNPSSNSSCDSGIESPTRKVSKDKYSKPSERRSFRSSKGKTRLLHGKNIVVSSYTTPTPRKPVIFQSFDHGISADTDTRETELQKPSSEKVHESSVKNEPSSNNTSFAENPHSDVFEKDSSKESEIISKNEQETIKSDDENTISGALHKVPNISPNHTTDVGISSTIVKQNEDEKTNIPLPKRTSSTKILETFEHERSKLKSPLTLSVSKSAKMFEKLGQENNKSSQIPSANKIRDKSKISQLPKQRTTKPTASVALLGKQTIAVSTITTAKPSPKSKASSRITVSTDKSSSSGKKTEIVQSKSTKVPTKRSSGKDEEPSVIVGNSNASVQPTSKSTDQIPSLAYSQREISGAIVIERKNSSKKTKSNNNQNDVIQSKDSKTSEKINNKRLQQQIDNLENQLKERANRIDELELSLENNNNTLNNERNEFDTIKKELDKDIFTKDHFIKNQEEKVTSASKALSKSNQGLEALSLVIKYYLAQVENLSDALQSSKKLNKDLKSAQTTSSADNQQLKTNLSDLKKKLENESCRCENLQKEFETLNVNHEKELSRVRDQYNEEVNRVVEKHKNEQQNESKKVFDEHQKQLKDIDQTHQNEAQLLKDHYQRKLNELKEEHKKILEDKEKQHLETVARLKLEGGNSSPRLKSPVGTPISPENVPEELKSLHVVLEMKNDELKNLRTKNMELSRKVDEYYELQTKYDALNQKSQSLSEMLKQKSRIERQLSVERENLMEKFEQESRKVSRLAMEKEELIWRASNPDLTYKSLENLHEEQDDEDQDSPPSSLRSSGSFSNNSTPRGRNHHEAQISKKLKRRSMNF